MPLDLASDEFLTKLQEQLKLSESYRRTTQIGAEHHYSHPTYHVNLILTNDKDTRKLSRIVIDGIDASEATIELMSEVLSCTMKQLDSELAATPARCPEITTALLRRTEQGKPVNDLSEIVNGICYNLLIIRDESISFRIWKQD